MLFSMEFRKMHHKVVIKLIAVQLLTKDQKDLKVHIIL